jgi:hypothetical protein
MRARSLCAIVLLPLAVSCSAWRPVPGAALAPAQAERVDRARLFLHDGTVVLLKDATISPDSIIGLAGAPPTRFTVPRSDVVGVEAERAEVVTSFVAGALAVFGALFLAGRLNSL